jgi:hypothetical protein
MDKATRPVMSDAGVLRLRERVDAERDGRLLAEQELEKARQLIRESRGSARGKPHRCDYCGTPTYGQRTCPQHRDLPQLEWGGF